MGFEADSKILMITMQKSKKSPVHNATPGKRKKANKNSFKKLLQCYLQHTEGMYGVYITIDVIARALSCDNDVDAVGDMLENIVSDEESGSLIAFGNMSINSTAYPIHGKAYTMLCIYEEKESEACLCGGRASLSEILAHHPYAAVELRRLRRDYYTGRLKDDGIVGRYLVENGSLIGNFECIPISSINAEKYEVACLDETYHIMDSDINGDGMVVVWKSVV